MFKKAKRNIILRFRRTIFNTICTNTIFLKISIQVFRQIMGMLVFCLFLSNSWTIYKLVANFLLQRFEQ